VAVSTAGLGATLDDEATGAPPVWLIFSITVTGILANTMLSPVIPDVLDDLGVADDRAGWLVSAGTLPGILMAPAIGLMADRFGRKRVLVPCLTCFGVFGLVAALAPSFPTLLLARFGQGLGSAGLINLAVVIIGDHWEGEERTRLVGRNAAVLTASLALFPPLAGVLSDLGGWRLAFVPYGIGLVTAVLIWRLLPEFRPGGDDKFTEQLADARRVIARPVILATLATGFVLFVCIFGLFLTTMPVHLEEQFGLSASGRGLIIAVPAIPSTLMALNLTSVRRRLGLRRLVVVAASMFTVAFLIIGRTDLLVVLCLGAAFYGLAEGIFIPTLQDVASSASPPEQRGTVVAVWVGAARAGQTAGPLAAGALFAATSTNTTFVAGAGLTAVLAVALYFGPLRESRITPG
jgi:predicted MFS family arabinose efflux permease